MKTRIVILSLAGLLIAGCSRPGAEEMFNKALDAQKSGQTDDAIALYQDLIKTYPDSARSPEACYAVGTIYQNQKKDFSRSIMTYRKLVHTYPQHATSPNAAFLIGFIYNNDLGQFDSARIAYEQFIRAYPNDHLVNDAKFELSNLGKSPEEILNAHTQVVQHGSKPPREKKKK